MVIYPDIGRYTSVAEVWCKESYFLVLYMLGCVSSCVLEEYCVRDCMSDVSVGFFSCYISVGFGILMEVGDVELGLGCLYSLFTYLYGKHMD